VSSDEDKDTSSGEHRDTYSDENRTDANRIDENGAADNAGNSSCEMPVEPVRYASKRPFFRDRSDLEVWRTFMYFTLSPEQLIENAFPVKTDIGIMVNYTPFSNMKLSDKKIKKCGIFESCPCCQLACEKTNCGKCFHQLFHLTLDECIRHPGRRVAFRVFTGWTRCGKDLSDPGCVVLDQRVWNGVVRGNNVPLKGYVVTPNLETSTDNFAVYAIDCEMCCTRQGLEPTRVTVVHVYRETACHAYIQPDSQIIPYDSRYSGIFQSTLENVDKTLRDVRKDLLSFVN
ncbi:hypothetical protein HN011_006259, partial [Eciton burchellii]